MSDRGTNERLASLESDLADHLLSEPDQSSGEFSARQCGMWAQLWAVRLLRAQASYDAAKTSESKRLAMTELRVTDESTREWQKRKATAHEKERIDYLRKIVDFIEKQEKAASALGDIPE